MSESVLIESFPDTAELPSEPYFDDTGLLNVQKPGTREFQKFSLGANEELVPGLSDNEGNESFHIGKVDWRTGNVTSHRSTEAARQWHESPALANDAEQVDTRFVKGSLITSTRELPSGENELIIYDLNSDAYIKAPLDSDLELIEEDIDGSGELTQVVAQKGARKLVKGSHMTLENFLYYNEEHVEVIDRETALGKTESFEFEDSAEALDNESDNPFEIEDVGVGDDGRHNISFINPDNGRLFNWRLDKNKRYLPADVAPEGHEGAVIVTYDDQGEVVSVEAANEVVAGRVGQYEREQAVKNGEPAVEATLEPVPGAANANPEAGAENTTSLAGSVLSKVTKVLWNQAKDKNVKRVSRWDSQTNKTEVVEVAVDPATEFVSNYFSKVDRLGSGDFHDVVPDVVDNLHNIGLQQQEIDNGESTIDSVVINTEHFIKRGLVSEKAASAFWSNLGTLKRGLSSEYSSLVKKLDDVGEIDNEAYQRQVQETLQLFGDRVKEQESGGFMHVNEHLSTADNETVNRLYISTRADADPGQAVKIWGEMLKDMELDESVYFKVPNAVSNRYESIVMFIPESMSSEQKQQIIDEYNKRCPQELRDTEQKMPTGVEVAPGMYETPNPAALNMFLMQATRKGPKNFDQLSMNLFAAGMSELSMRLAASDYVDRGVDASQVSPQELAETASPYFEELMRLSFIDPETMKDVVLGK